jgi:cobyrinic acid a,c-diamide synthase
MSRGLILAAPASGAGKTTLALALLRRWRQQGRHVAAAKLGPDYIDTAFHSAAVGGTALNLDPWAMRPALLDASVRRLEASGEIVLCEGAMGLFDGVGASEQGSTAELAARLRWPVVLVVDARHQGASVAALIEGFVRHRTDVEIAGVMFNRVGSTRHGALLAEATKRALPEIAILGAVPRDPDLALGERHLGLVQAAEHPDLDAFLDRAAAIVGAAVDLERLAALARPARLAPPAAAESVVPIPPLGQRIAIARDSAFLFTYSGVLEGWRAAGAELTFFSPLADEAPARETDSVYLPGGYPELHAARLAANGIFLGGLRAAAARGATIFGECGGFMALGRALIDGEGRAHEMAGLLPVTTSFATRRLHLGYREMALAFATPLGPRGARFRGHEFHYASLSEAGGAPPMFHAWDGTGASLGPAGSVEGRVMGSFLHLIDRANYVQGSDSRAGAKTLSLTP